MKAKASSYEAGTDINDLQTIIRGRPEPSERKMFRRQRIRQNRLSGNLKILRRTRDLA